MNNETSNLIYDYIKQNPYADNKQIAEACNSTYSIVTTILNRMKKYRTKARMVKQLKCFYCVDETGDNSETIKRLMPSQTIKEKFDATIAKVKSVNDELELSEEDQETGLKIARCNIILDEALNLLREVVDENK